MQFQADLLGIPVIVPAVEELSALGVAFMGGLTHGLWFGTGELARLPVRTQEYRPRMGAGQRAALLAGWRSAIVQTLSRKVL
jgi:glycerol kinase